MARQCMPPGRDPALPIQRGPDTMHAGRPEIAMPHVIFPRPDDFGPAALILGASKAASIAKSE